jgi:hypothetical protein
VSSANRLASVKVRIPGVVVRDAGIVYGTDKREEWVGINHWRFAGDGREFAVVVDEQAKVAPLPGCQSAPVRTKVGLRERRTHALSVPRTMAPRRITALCRDRTNQTELPGSVVPARDYYRVAWRAMAANTGERTLLPALIPPGTSHIHGVFSAAAPTEPLDRLVLCGATASALLSDFAVRSAPKATIYAKTFERLPRITKPDIANEIILRYLRLVCLTEAYSDLWQEIIGTNWTPDVPLRRAEERRQAMVELDALVALSLDITADELCTIYRTQFPVLRGYDTSRDYYDSNGRLVPNSVIVSYRKRGDLLSIDERTLIHPESNIPYTYELPFRLLDREDDLRAAYSEFSK